MPTASMQRSVSVGGISISGKLERDGDQQVSVQPSAIAAAKAGTLTTRADDNTGSATLNTGHGIVDSDVVDVYWTGGKRYGMTVGSVATNVVPIDGGAGDNLPTETTALTLCKQVEVDIANFSGDDLVAIAAKMTRRGHIHFQETGGTGLLSVEIAAANEVWGWCEDDGFTNPLASAAVGKLKVSNADSAGTNTLQLGILMAS